MHLSLYSNVHVRREGAGPHLYGSNLSLGYVGVAPGGGWEGSRCYTTEDWGNAVSDLTHGAGVEVLQVHLGWRVEEEKIRDMLKHYSLQ